MTENVVVLASEREGRLWEIDLVTGEGERLLRLVCRCKAGLLFDGNVLLATRARCLVPLFGDGFGADCLLPAITSVSSMDFPLSCAARNASCNSVTRLAS